MITSPKDISKPSTKLRSDWLRRILAAIALALVTTAPAPAAADDGKVTNFLLDSGMEVVVIPDHRAPIVTHMVWYKVGSADEPPGKSGIAHFFEHLMFKATTNHAAGELSRAVSAIGGSNNAYTFYDYTAYVETVPPSALEQMMSFEADRMLNLSLTEDDIKTERDVVLEERRSSTDNEPQAVLQEEIDATLWQNHPYRVPVIGWMQELEQLNRTDAVNFYGLYRPNNAVLVVAGDVEPETVKALAEKTYGKIARGPDLPPRIRPVEPEQNTRRTVTLTDGRVSVPSFTTQWVVPSYHTAKPGEAEALDVLSEILGGGNRSRLYQELVVRQGIAAAAGAFFQGTMLDDTNFTVYGAPRGDAKFADVQAAVDAEIARIAKEGVTSDELEKAKDRFVRSMIFARDEQEDMASIYGSTLATGGNVQDLQQWPDRIRKVTADQVKAVAARYLNLDHSTTGYLLPKTEN
ncbi:MULTISPECIES: pitrilysin family protein [Mesorhizobium]|uniref:M16 family metallopeptidase n=1 Tax=Mesorhizobium TaxID=68287 RepID=UPI0007ECBCE1|nr:MULTISPECIES: pitrilysin family protein [Mesorhizobium]PBB51831.1 insulinase family protein [Mesorhizobium loti]QIA25562.1 insulinase family protein [Mesorhizobium sp. AA22]